MKIVEETTSNNYIPSYWHNPGTEPLSPLTLGQLMVNAAQRWGNREALVSVYQGHRFTFREILHQADCLAAGMLKLGLSPGDQVAIWASNSSEWYITRIAIARAGMVAVQIDPAYQSPQLLHVFKKLDVKALFCADSLKNNSYYEIVRALVPELDSCPEYGVQLNCSKVPSLKTLVFMSDKQYRGAYRYDDIKASAEPEFLQRVNELVVQPDDACAIMFTSGTTGYPKAAVLSHHNLVNNAFFVGRGMEMHTKYFRLMLPVQFCHVSGSLGGIICALHYGVTTVLPSQTYEAKATLDAILQERCNMTFAVPAVCVDLITTARTLGIEVTIDVFGVGGAPLFLALVRQLKDAFGVRRMCSVYGMTEISIAIESRPNDTEDQTTSTAGHILDHIEVKVVNTEGEMVPMGTPGELWVRGYSVMREYWGDEENTRQFITKDGWAKTGDQFVLREDGYAQIVGRIKDVIIRIGDKIFPKELEEFFQEHPGIVEAQAFGVPDQKVGEEICVYLRLQEGVILTKKDVVNYCKDKVPEYRIPRYIRFATQFPRTSIGKVQKFQLLKKLEDEINSSKQI